MLFEIDKILKINFVSKSNVFGLKWFGTVLKGKKTKQEQVFQTSEDNT